MSTQISWSKEFETGIDIIDQQHMRIFECLRDIDQAISEQSAGAIEGVVKALIDYAISHNTFEETLMERAGYPMLAAHRKVHEAFMIRALTYADRLNLGEDHITVAREVRDDIGLWLSNHIKRDDKPYVPFVKKSLDGGFAARMIGILFSRDKAA